MCRSSRVSPKATLVMAVVLALCPTPALAGAGKVFDEVLMNSQILKGERKYAVYLPPDYASSHRSYPIIEYRVRDGAHNWTYWRTSLPQVLAFVSDAFHQH